VSAQQHGAAAGRGSPGAACDADDHCITCGDVALAMRVLVADPAQGLAWCCRADDRDGSGACEWVDVQLVGDLAAGDAVLVHAGTALVRLTEPEEVSP
jgi:HupF/HypC family